MEESPFDGGFTTAASAASAASGSEAEMFCVPQKSWSSSLSKRTFGGEVDDSLLDSGLPAATAAAFCSDFTIESAGLPGLVLMVNVPLNPLTQRSDPGKTPIAPRIRVAWQPRHAADASKPKRRNRSDASSRPEINSKRELIYHLSPDRSVPVFR